MSSCGRWGIAIGVLTLVVACATGEENNSAYIAGAVDVDSGGVGTSNQDSGPQQVLDVDSGSTSGGKDSGATNPPPTDSGTTGPCTPAITINEVQSDGATASDEFVELYNAASCSVPLNGFKLGYYSSAGVGSGSGGAPIIYYTGGAGDSIPSHGYFVLGGAGFSGKSNGTMSGGLKDTGGQVGIQDGTGKLLDAVGYGTGTTGAYVEKSPAVFPPSKQSIGRKPDGTDTNSNSADFTVFTTPTPGASN